MARKKKTPDYTRRAVDRYNESIDRVSVGLPKGTADIIRENIGGTVAGYIKGLIREDLTRRGLLQPEPAADASRPETEAVDAWSGLE